MIQISGVVVGLDKVDAMLKGFSLRSMNLIRVFRQKINPSVAKMFERVFDSKGRELGTGVSWVPWRPISAMTQRGRDRPGHGREGPTAILRDTNRLWASLAKLNGPEAVIVYEPLGYSRGTSVPHAKWATGGFISRTVFGRPRRGGPKRVVPRPIAHDPMPKKYTDQWERDIAQHIAENK
jgi:hypothetical protein